MMVYGIRVNSPSMELNHETNIDCNYDCHPLWLYYWIFSRQREVYSYFSVGNNRDNVICVSSIRYEIYGLLHGSVVVA